MGQDLRLSCRFGFQILIEVRHQNHGVKLDYRTLNYETIRVFYTSRRTVRQSDSPFVSPSFPLPPTRPSAYLPFPYLLSICSMYTCQHAGAQHPHFPQSPTAVPISSHRRHAAPYPVVARAKLFAVHSWQSAPETGNSFTGRIPSDTRVSVGPVKRHDTLHRVNVIPGRRSFKQARVRRFVLCIDTHKKTNLS